MDFLQAFLEYVLNIFLIIRVTAIQKSLVEDLSRDRVYKHVQKKMERRRQCDSIISLDIVGLTILLARVFWLLKFFSINAEGSSRLKNKPMKGETNKAREIADLRNETKDKEDTGTCDESFIRQDYF